MSLLVHHWCHLLVCDANNGGLVNLIIVWTLYQADKHRAVTGRQRPWINKLLQCVVVIVIFWLVSTAFSFQYLNIKYLLFLWDMLVVVCDDIILPGKRYTPDSRWFCAGMVYETVCWWRQCQLLQRHRSLVTVKVSSRTQATSTQDVFCPANSRHDSETNPWYNILHWHFWLTATLTAVNTSTVNDFKILRD